MLKKIVIEGSPEEMGNAHGEILKDKIVNLANERKQLLYEQIDGLTEDKLIDVTLDTFRLLKLSRPLLYRELVATSISAGIEEHELLIAGGYTDILDSLSSNDRGKISECTVAINATTGYLYGTWDSHPSAEKSLVLLERRPTLSNVNTLALTTAGWPAQQGLNNYGLAFAITNLTPKTAIKKGIHYIVANAVMANSKSIADFLGFAQHNLFSSGHSYLLLDKSRRAVVIETNKENLSVVEVQDNFVMTNHYCIPPQIDNNDRYAYYKASKERRSEMSEASSLINSPEEFSKWLSNSKIVNKKYKIDAIAVTCAYFFIVPETQTLFYCKGASYGEQMRSVTFDTS